MRALPSRLLLATALLAAPAFAQSDEDAASDAATTEIAVEAEAPVDTAGMQDAVEAGEDDAEEAEASEEESWANKMRRRHHEGDVALGVCGARMSVLMWFYQSSVADGREDLQPAYEAIKESRTVLKNEAERRAVEDGVGTSVSVMNEQSEELWLELVKASEEAETFQVAHDELFANVQECLTIFFNRAAKPVEAAPEETAAEETPEEDEAAPAD